LRTTCAHETDVPQTHVAAYLEAQTLRFPSSNNFFTHSSASKPGSVNTSMDPQALSNSLPKTTLRLPGAHFPPQSPQSQKRSFVFRR